MLTFNLTDSVSLPDSTKEPHLQCSVLPAKKFHLMKNPPQNLNLKWIAVLKEMLRMEKLCAAIGFTKEMIESCGRGFRKTPDEPRKGGGMKL